MFKKILKHQNPKGQSTLEFCLAVPVVLLLTLGVIDVAKANIIKLENTQAMQAYLSLASADGKDTSAEKIKGAAGDYIQQTSMFCTKVHGANKQADCKAGAEVVQTTIRLERVGTGPLQPGNQICMAAKSEYTPYYSGIYSGNKMTVYSRACTLMETQKNNVQDGRIFILDVGKDKIYVSKIPEGFRGKRER